MKTVLNYLAIALAAVSLSVFTSCKPAAEVPAEPAPAEEGGTAPAETPAEEGTTPAAE